MMNTDTWINLIAFTVLSLLWLGFAAALFFNRELLHQAWHRLRSWPLAGQLLIWLLALPVVLSLWIWQMRWPGWLRMTLIAALAWVTEYTFFPRLPL